MEGIKETKEMLVGVNEVSLVLVKNFKGGIVGEAEAFYQKIVSDPEFKAKVFAAYDGYQKIPAEVSDLSVTEVAELGAVQLQYVPKFVEALNP